MKIKVYMRLKPWYNSSILNWIEIHIMKKAAIHDFKKYIEDCVPSELTPKGEFDVDTLLMLLIEHPCLAKMAKIVNDSTEENQ